MSEIVEFPAGEELREALSYLIKALGLLDPPVGDDEGVGAALARAPEGHVAWQVARVIVKCLSCDGLTELRKMTWSVGGGLPPEPACCYCSSPHLVLWRRPGETGVSAPRKAVPA